MTKQLAGRHVAVLAADGAEVVDLVQPRQAVEDAGATTELLSINEAPPRADRNPVSGASPDDYDALIVSGGAAHSDAAAMDFVRAFVASGKPIGIISHDPTGVVETGVVRGRTLTSAAREDGPAFCQEIIAQFAV